MRQPLSTSTDFRLLYMDDSGSHRAGLLTFTWLQLDPAVWVEAEQAWLAFRRDLYARHRIPASARLHATDLAGGRRSPSLDSRWNIRAHGADIIHAALEVIGGLPGIEVGTAYRRIGTEGFHACKAALYHRLTVTLDTELGGRGLHGMVFMDGDGTDSIYAAAHRKLSAKRRHLIEAPVFRLADNDQWVQMADIAAWSGFQSLHRKAHRGRKVWTWYPQLLAQADLTGGPRQL